jgi:predicted MarR family transcription regulator
LLVSSIKRLGFDTEDLSRLSALLRALSGSYDQAARGAAAM